MAINLLSVEGMTFNVFFRKSTSFELIVLDRFSQSAILRFTTPPLEERDEGRGRVGDRGGILLEDRRPPLRERDDRLERREALADHRHLLLPRSHPQIDFNLRSVEARLQALVEAVRRRSEGLGLLRAVACASPIARTWCHSVHASG